MSDAVAFMVVLPAMILAILLLNAAGTLGVANYRTAEFAESAAAHAADVLTNPEDAGAAPRDHARWQEVVSAVELSGRAATAGVCNQTDPDFYVLLASQPGNRGNPASVAAAVGCPVDVGRLLSVDRVTAVSVAPTG